MTKWDEEKIDEAVGKLGKIVDECMKLEKDLEINARIVRNMGFDVLTAVEQMNQRVRGLEKRIRALESSQSAVS